MNLLSSLQSHPTVNIFAIPEPISASDRLLLTIRQASIQTHSLSTASQDISLSVTPLDNSTALELKMNSGDANSNWNIRISYILVHWPSIESALTIHPLTLSSLPFHAQLANGMYILA